MKKCKKKIVTISNPILPVAKATGGAPNRAGLSLQKSQGKMLPGSFFYSSNRIHNSGRPFVVRIAMLDTLRSLYFFQ